MVRMSDDKIKIEKLYLVLLWVLAILYFYFISIHSSLSAEASAKVSRVIAKKAFLVVENVTETMQMGDKKDISYRNVVIFIRKSAHVINFYILGFLYSMTALKTNPQKTLSVFAAAIICGLLGAIIDECNQLFVHGRSAEINDVFIDFIGVLWGCITFFVGIIVCKVQKYGRNM